MLVSIPLHLDTLPEKPTAADLEAALAAPLCRRPAGARRAGKRTRKLKGRLDARGVNKTDTLELYVFGKRPTGRRVLVARLDNLGKGAAGAAVQNLKLMLGIAES